MSRQMLASLAPAGFVTDGSEDCHVHTEWCNDSDFPVTDVVSEAIGAGLRWVNTTAHVRADTRLGHVQGYVAAVDAATASYNAQRSHLRVTTSLETKILNTAGDLDLPDWYDDGIVDFLLISDHQVPLRDGPGHPDAVTAMLTDGTMSVDEVVDLVVDATCNAMWKHPGSIVAHPLSIFPKVGIDPNTLADYALGRFTAMAVATGCAVDINAKWKTPGMNLVELCLAAGVPLLAGSDAHSSGILSGDRYLPHLR